MAKRYHQTHKDKMHERHGEEHSVEKKMAHRMEERASHRSHMMHSGHYAGAEPRRRQEMEDSGMIREDHSAIANMPQSMMMKPWPSGGYGMPEGLDDTIKGVNRQMDADDNQRRKHNVPHKY